MWFLSPLSWLLFACGLVWAAWWLRQRRRLLLGGAVLLAGVAIVAMTPLFANALVGWLESGRAIPEACNTALPHTAVVLAGGIDGRPRADDDYSVLMLASRRRVERAVEWWHEQPGRRLVISGGSSHRRGTPKSHLMAAYARALGVQAEAITTEDASKTTWDNAQHLARLRPALPARLVLITSAMHLPRATYSMEQAGFEVCGIGADSRFVPFELPGYLIPQASAMTKTEEGLHEVVGLLYYRWLGFRAKREATRPDQESPLRDARK